MRASHDARRRPRFDGEYRYRLGRHGDPAIGLNDQDVAPVSGLLQRFLKTAEITLDNRPDIGIEKRRGASLVLAHHPRHTAGKGDIDAGQLVAQNLADPLLVIRVHVRKQKRHRNRLDTALAQYLGDGPHPVFLQGLHHPTLGINPFGNPEDAPLVNQRPGFLGLAIVVAFEDAETGNPTGRPHDHQGVLKPGAGEHCRGSAGISEDSVARQSGGMDEASGIAQQIIDLAAHFPGRQRKAVHNATLQVVGRR